MDCFKTRWEEREPVWPVRQTSYLLLNLWGCLSLMEWKRWAIEASCSSGHKRNDVLKSNLKFDLKNSGSPLRWKSSCWWFRRARGLLPPEGRLGSPGCSSGPWAPTRLLQSRSGSLAGLSPHSLVGRKGRQQIQFQCQPVRAGRFASQDRKGLTSSPTQTTSQVVSSAQRQDGDWRSRLEVFPVCNHASVSLQGKNWWTFYT